MRKPKYPKICCCRRIAYAIPAILSVMAGCAGGDEPEGGADGSVMFAAYVGDAAESRALMSDIGRLRATGFGVFAIATGDDEFNPDAAGGLTSGFMHNQHVVWKAEGTGTGMGKWTYSPERTWPESKLSFFAYAPYSAAPAATGITGITGADTPGIPRVGFRMDNDVDRQTDLLYAGTANTLNLRNGGQVQFNFRHAMSRVGFRCGVGASLDEATTLTVTGVTLSSSALGLSGDLNLYSGEWENVLTGEAACTLESDDFAAGSNVFKNSTGTAMSDLTSNGKYLMLIPSDGAVELTVTVNYDVETIDPNLTSGKFKSSNTVTRNFDFNFEKGKAYSLSLVIGIRSVIIGADVSEWDDEISGWNPVEPQSRNKK